LDFYSFIDGFAYQVKFVIHITKGSTADKRTRDFIDELYVLRAQSLSKSN